MLAATASGGFGPSNTGSTSLEERELYFELGGPAYRLMKRIGVIKGAGPCVFRRSVLFIWIAWLPLLILTTLEGHAFGPTPRSGFLLDLTTYARFFLGVPLIFAAEAVVGPQMRSAGLRFLHAGIVRPESEADFTAAVNRVRRLREAYLPEVVFLIVALCAPWFLSLERLTGLGATSWRTSVVEGRVHLSMAGMWYNFVSVPLVQFFVLRWLWRLIVWTLFLWKVSRLDLNLLATHADGAGGLGFLGTAHVSMAIFPFAIGCVLAAEVAFRIKFEGLSLYDLQSMIPLLIAYLALVECLTFGPLMIFISPLARVRLEALRTYGILVQRHNQLFHEKWIQGGRSADESPLGSPDMSSLIDLGSSFAVIKDMNVVPVRASQLIRVAIITCLPVLPLLFLSLPFMDVVKLLASVVR